MENAYDIMWKKYKTKDYQFFLTYRTTKIKETRINRINGGNEEKLPKITIIVVIREAKYEIRCSE